MPSFYSSMPRTPKEPRSRFYPPQGFDTTNQQQPPLPEQPQMPTNPNRQAPQIPMENRIQTMPQAPMESPMQMPARSMPEHKNTPRQRTGEMPYFEGRYPLMLKRLYDAAGNLMDTYSANEFIYDAYPDYLSLRLMRDRLLRENPDLTEEFLQAGCPIMWLEFLADTITSELLCRKRRQQAN